VTLDDEYTGRYLQPQDAEAAQAKAQQLENTFPNLTPSQRRLLARILNGDFPGKPTLVGLSEEDSKRFNDLYNSEPRPPHQMGDLPAQCVSDGYGLLGLMSRDHVITNHESQLGREAIMENFKTFYHPPQDNGLRIQQNQLHTTARNTLRTKREVMALEEQRKQQHPPKQDRQGPGPRGPGELPL
jgi:hypothetical protein